MPFILRVMVICCINMHKKENKYRSRLIKIHVQFVQLVQLHNIDIAKYTYKPVILRNNLLTVSIRPFAFVFADGTAEENPRRFYV